MTHRGGLCPTPGSVTEHGAGAAGSTAVPLSLGGVLRAGDSAPSFTLTDAQSGETFSDPWADGPVVLAFFKTTCPVCHMSAPKVQALADAGVRVIGIGEDPPGDLAVYSEMTGLRAPVLSEADPYPVSEAFGIDTVPTMFLVGGDGVVAHAVVSWDREAWNRLAVAAGAGPVSHEGDGLPPFRPG